MEERRATLLKGQLVHAVLASDEGTVGLNIYCIEVNKFSSSYTYSGGSLVPSLYRMWKKNLVKCVFNFGSVRQDVGVANQIAEQCLRHWLYLKKIGILT